jgi:hypothetical protein
MGSNLDRSNGTGERGASPSASPASSHEEPAPDFRALLRRAATDLRAEATGKIRPDKRDRLLRLAATLDRYAEESA